MDSAIPIEVRILNMRHHLQQLQRKSREAHDEARKASLRGYQYDELAQAAMNDLADLEKQQPWLQEGM